MQTLDLLLDDTADVAPSARSDTGRELPCNNGAMHDGALVAAPPTAGELPGRVRVLCVDDTGALLLLRWRDPVDGHVFFEPPGGGVERGEHLLDAARRELYEETGLEPAIRAGFARVWRDHTWKGRRREEVEGWFLAECGPAPIVAPGALTASEIETLAGWQWVGREALASLDAPLEPETVFAVLDELRARTSDT